MPVTLTFSGTDYDLQIATYTPHQDAVPGTGGSTAALRASASPATYDFTTTSQTFALTWQGVTYTLSLVADYGTMSGLLAAINSGLTGSGLIAQDDGGVIRIVEISSPWRGGSITSSFLPASVLATALCLLPVQHPVAEARRSQPVSRWHTIPVPHFLACRTARSGFPWLTVATNTR
jgi:hypothetical protein